MRRIAILEIAAQHGVRKQRIFKLVKRLQIEPVKQRSSDTKGQEASYITQDEYERLKPHLDGRVGQESATQSGTDAVFYLLLPEPQCDPRRFKVGFATDVEERIRHFKTIAPHVELVRKWPCKALWEKTAIDCVTDGCERLHTEVFRSEAIEKVIDRADRFFALMPRPFSD